MQTQSDLWRLRFTANGERTASPLLRSAARFSAARLSPNGRWLAYSTNESGRYEVVVQPYPEVTRGKWQISTAGGVEPVWRGDGAELFYLAADGNLMAADVESVEEGDAFVAGQPHALFQTGVVLSTSPIYLTYDATPDGQRFLVGPPGGVDCEPDVARRRPELSVSARI